MPLPIAPRSREFAHTQYNNAAAAAQVSCRRDRSGILNLHPASLASLLPLLRTAAAAPFEFDIPGQIYLARARLFSLCNGLAPRATL